MSFSDPLSAIEEITKTLQNKVNADDGDFSDFYALILTDFEMPNMNGAEVITKIRSLYSEYPRFDKYLPYICVISGLEKFS